MTTTLERREVPAPPRPPRNWNNIAALVVGLLLVVAGFWSISSLGINAATIVDSFDNAVDFVRRMFPLDFPPLGETIACNGLGAH